MSIYKTLYFDGLEEKNTYQNNSSQKFFNSSVSSTIDLTFISNFSIRAYEYEIINNEIILSTKTSQQVLQGTTLSSGIKISNFKIYQIFYDPIYTSPTKLNLIKDYSTFSTIDYILNFTELGTFLEANNNYLIRYTDSTNSTFNSNIIEIYFGTIKTDISPFSISYQKYSNDSFSKLNSLSKIIDTDNIFLNNDTLNFEYFLSEYNSIQNKYLVTDKLLQINNQKIIEDLYIKQFAYEYKNYFEDIEKYIGINSENTLKTINTREELQILKNLILKNIVIFNNFKGNQIGIEIIFTIFANALGKQLTSIQIDPFQALKYVINSNLDIKYWLKDIKPIVHPIPWVCQYNFYDVDNDKPWVNFPYYNLIKNFSFYNNYWKSDISYIDYFSDSFNDDNPSADTIDGKNSHYNLNLNVSIDDTLSQLQFKFKPTEYTYKVNREYIESNEYSNIIKSYIIKSNTTEGYSQSSIVNVKFEFNRIGLVHTFVYDLYFCKKLVSRFETKENTHTFQFSRLNFSSYTLKLSLYNYDFVKTIDFNFSDSATELVQVSFKDYYTLFKNKILQSYFNGFYNNYKFIDEEDILISDEISGLDLRLEQNESCLTTESLSESSVFQTLKINILNWMRFENQSYINYFANNSITINPFAYRVTYINNFNSILTNNYKIGCVQTDIFKGIIEETGDLRFIATEDDKVLTT